MLEAFFPASWQAQWLITHRLHVVEPGDAADGIVLSSEAKKHWDPVPGQEAGLSLKCKPVFLGLLCCELSVQKLPEANQKGHTEGREDNPPHGVR